MLTVMTSSPIGRSLLGLAVTAAAALVLPDRRVLVSELSFALNVSEDDAMDKVDGALV